MNRFIPMTVLAAAVWLGLEGVSASCAADDGPTTKVRATLKGHTGVVWCVAFSPDGKTLASASDDETIKLWETATGNELATLKGHYGSVQCVAFSPDGKTVASGAADFSIRLWDAATGKERAVLKGHPAPVRCVAFSPDGKTLASASDDAGLPERTLKLWDVETGKEKATLKGHEGGVIAVAFSPEGNTLAVRWRGPKNPAVGRGDGKGTGHAEGAWLAVIPWPTVRTARRWPRAVDDKTIKLWDVATGKEQATLKGPRPVVSVAFSPDGKTLASGSWTETIKLWDVATGKEQATLKGHTSGCVQWRSARTARRWPRGAGTRRSSCGT